MPFPDELAPRLRFRTNPIKAAVIQLRFPHRWSLVAPETLAQLQAELTAYPIAKPSEVQFQVQIENQQAMVAMPNRFTDRSGAWTVAVAADAISLETSSYVSWEEFRDRFAELVGALRDLLPGEFSRVGLRYINELTHPGTETIQEWVPLLRDGMLTYSASAFIGPFVRRNQQLVHLQIGDRDKVNLRHGFVGRQDLTDQAPSSVYLVDVDVFADQTVSRDELFELLERHHSWAWTLFRHTLGDEMVAAMGGEAQ